MDIFISWTRRENITDNMIKVGVGKAFQVKYFYFFYFWFTNYINSI